MAKTVEEAQAAVTAAEQALAAAKGKGVSAATAASRALSAAKKELQAAQAGVSTEGKTAVQVNAAIRQSKAVKEAETRAATNPLLNFAERPDAPPADEEYIYYYSWIGDTRSGSWKLYRAPNTEENMATYGSRAIGGETKATAGSIKGANTLKTSSVTPVVKKIVLATVENPDGSSTITYSDGSTETIPSTKINASTSNVTVSTNIDVLKSMLRGLGFNSSIVDSSSSFLLSLLKDGLDYDNAVQVFLSSKDYTTKDGKKFDSPFYAEYGYLNEGLIKSKTPAELYNAVEGYKEVAANYNLNPKFLSKDYIKKYVKNDVSAANLAERANLARLKSVNADPAYIDSLRRFGYISSAADLTDFFLDPEIGQDTLNQRRASAAFGAEAIKRAQQGVQFSTERFNQIVSGLIAKGISPENIGINAAEGFANIAETLQPLGKLASIYENLPASDITNIQKELETEEFTGLASERRKRLRELEIRKFQATSGVTGVSARTPTAGMI